MGIDGTREGDEWNGEDGEQGQHDEREKAVAATVHRGLCMRGGRAKDIR